MTPPLVVAVVAAYEGAGTIADTVAALLAIDGVTRVVVVDDGSSDATAERAAEAGAVVERLPANAGKGAAVAAGVKSAADADVYLLVDADVGATAAATRALLRPVVDGDADMAIGVLPPAGGRGGFGAVKRLAAAGIRRATGFEPRAPLSGQRAARGDLLRSLVLADRFGLEAAMTIDALRAGARVVEVDVVMEHRHTGRRLSGFRHRAGQGIDIVRALWPRMTSARARSIGLVGAAVLAVVAMLWSGQQWQPSSVPLASRPERVVVFGMPHVTFDDVAEGRAPNLSALIGRGAVAAMSVRTVSGRPSSAEAYATLGAGVRVEADRLAALAFDADERIGPGTAAEAAARLNGAQVTDARVVVPAGAVLGRKNRKHHLSSQPGALGDALNGAGLRAAVVGNADMPGSLDPRMPWRSRPAAVAVMDGRATVDAGTVDPGSLLVEDASAPFGRRSDPDKVLAATAAALGAAHVVVVDPGDLDRAAAAAPFATDAAAGEARTRAVRDTDAILGRVSSAIDDDTLLLVLATTPDTSAWALAPAVAVGRGVPAGRLVSPSTKRDGVVVLTDVATTILTALGVDAPRGMVGQAWRYRPGDADLAGLRALERQTDFREAIYRPTTTVYVVVQVLLHLFAIFAMSRRGGPGRYAGSLRFLLLAAAAFPLACFAFRAIPQSDRLGALALPALALLAAGIAALVRHRSRHPLQPLTTIMGATIAVLVLDVATGSRLHVSNVLGYSLQSAGRFYGFPNTTFGVLVACTLLVAAAHVHYSTDRRSALVRVAVLMAIVVVVDAAPGLGDDAGGVIALVPIAALTLLAMAGARLSLRRVAVIGVTTVAALALVAAADRLRAPDQQAHIGRFLSSLTDGGPSVLLETIERKEGANFRILSKSVWTWVIPAGAALMLYLLVWERRFVSIVPRGSALRIGVISTVVGSLVAFLVNDSGPVVTALFFVFLGPFLVLLAVHQEDDARSVTWNVADSAAFQATEREEVASLSP